MSSFTHVSLHLNSPINFLFQFLLTYSLTNPFPFCYSGGANLQEAFENVALSMFNYMTPLEGITDEGPSAETHTYKAEAHDLPSLLYHWLDELLFDFSNEFFVPKTMKITSFDREAWKIEAEGTGERFDRGRHVSGTEIKAITYSAMQINETEGDAEIFVIVDI